MTNTFKCGGAQGAVAVPSPSAAGLPSSPSSSSSASEPLSQTLRRWAGAAVAPLMPEGYPHSVSPDYAAYQVWDTLQCLCSSVTGALSTRAVLMGVGVGQAEATALSGTVSWLLRDVWSKVGAVWFAAHHATDLDNDAKRWRFVADLANDAALFLEIFSVHLPPMYFMLCASVASLFKAVCGVAGGSSRASLTQHFSIRHNMADVAAKDGSQETVASLIGMFLGMFVAWLIPETDFLGTCIGYLLFTSLHLYTNYRAVTALVLTHFNRHRARHAMVGYMGLGGAPSSSSSSASSSLVGGKGTVMGCEEANRRESVLLLGRGGEPFTIVCGAKPSDVLRRHGSSLTSSTSPSTAAPINAIVAEAAAHISAASEDSQRFAVIADAGQRRYEVLLGAGLAHEADALLWAYYCVCADHYAPSRKAVSSAPPRLLLPREGDGFTDFREKAVAAGWDVSKVQFRVFEWRVGVVM